MNQNEAIKKLQKKLGRDLAWRVNRDAPNAEDRAEYREQSRLLSAQVAATKDAMEKRRAELLKDPEYAALRDKYQATKDEQSRAFSMSRSFRISVGTITKSLGFFHVQAEGDTWAEVVEKIK